MQTTILKKILTELEAKTPRLDYIRGMVETLVCLGTPFFAMDNKLDELFVQPGGAITPYPVLKPLPLVTDDEAAILDAKAKASLQKVRQMSTE